MTDFLASVVIIGAYLMGSFSSAIIVCKLAHLPDPRTEGSQNPGATNVLRIGGKCAALATLIGDVLKGTIPVLIARALALDEWVIALSALAAFLGHLYPIFFQFKGGKGVATAIGCLLALNLYAALAAILTWLIVLFISRFVSVASIIAALFAPFYVWFFTHELTISVIIAIMSVLLIVRHHSNIKKLYAGKELKIGKKS